MSHLDDPSARMILVLALQHASHPGASWHFRRLARKGIREGSVMPCANHRKFQEGPGYEVCSFHGMYDPKIGLKNAVCYKGNRYLSRVANQVQSVHHLICETICDRILANGGFIKRAMPRYFAGTF